MAGRRMFARSVTTTGRFMRLSAGAKYLYFALGMEADDDGFAEGWVVLRMTGQEEADLRALEKAGYVKVYGEDLITYITDWDTNNQIRKDRYRESRYAYLLNQEPEETPRKAVSSGEAAVEGKTPREQAPDAEKTQATAGERASGEEDALEAAPRGTTKTAAPQKDSGRAASLAEGAIVTAASLLARSAGTGQAAAGETPREEPPEKGLEMPEGKIDWDHFHPKTDEELQLFAEHLREKRRQKRQREKEELIQKYGFYIDVDKILYGTEPNQEAAG